MLRYKLITFDVTGTLLKFRNNVGHEYADAGRRMGINANANLLSDCFKQQWKIMNETHPNFGFYSGLGWEKWWESLVSNTFLNVFAVDKYEVSLDKNTLEALSIDLINRYNEVDSWMLNEGVVEILQFIRNKNGKIGVISNFDMRLEPILHNLHIHHYFDFIIGSYAVGYHKPNIEIFKHAEKMAQNFNICQPKDILHVGNDVQLDYKGAINAGWDACLICDKDYLMKLNFNTTNIQFVDHDLMLLKDIIFSNNRNLT